MGQAWGLGAGADVSTKLTFRNGTSSKRDPNCTVYDAVCRHKARMVPARPSTWTRMPSRCMAGPARGGGVADAVGTSGARARAGAVSALGTEADAPSAEPRATRTHTDEVRVFHSMRSPSSIRRPTYDLREESSLNSMRALCTSANPLAGPLWPSLPRSVARRTPRRLVGDSSMRRWGASSTRHKPCHLEESDTCLPQTRNWARLLA